MRRVHSDGGSEFKRAQSQLKQSGVEITITTPYTEQSNGLFERTQGVFFATMRSCLENAGINGRYWPEAIVHVISAKNILPHSITGKSAHEALYGENSNELKNMRPFGCKALYQPIQPKPKKSNTKPRLQKGINF